MLRFTASGSAVPADCRVNEGEIDVDEAALTGKSYVYLVYKANKHIANVFIATQQPHQASRCR